MRPWLYGAAAGLLLVVTLAVATPAQASCVLPYRVSDHKFTGVVLSTESKGRIATVRTDDGRIVTVIGGSSDENSFSTIDIAYRVGVRYEFHPLNGTSPYHDNACTATREVNEHLTTPSARAEEASPARGATLGAAGAVLAVAGTVVALYLLRRRLRVGRP